VQTVTDLSDMPIHRIPSDILAEFEAASRRPLAQRWRYAFVKTYKPVLDDASFRAFDTMEDYRRWCEDALPPWLGYGRSL
jgi:hypothetical protein